MRTTRTVNQHKKVFNFIGRLLRMPKVDLDATVKNVIEHLESGNPKDCQSPKMVAKRSYLGWALMIIQVENPLMIVLSGIVFLVYFPLELALQLKLFLIAHFL